MERRDIFLLEPQIFSGSGRGAVPERPIGGLNMSIELFIAVFMGDCPLTASLLSAGADPNARKTALWRGALETVSEHPDLVPYLLRREYADPNPLVIWTWTPLLLACAQSHWDIP